MARHPATSGAPLDGADAIARALLHGHGPVTEHWGRSPAIVHGVGLAECIPPVEEILGTPLLRTPYVTLFRDQAPMPPEAYSRCEKIVESMAAEALVDLRRFEEEVASGAGAKFNRMELWCPPVRRIAEALGTAAGRPIRVWGFYTREHAQMLPWHRDTAHNLELQVTGEKRWFLGGPFTVETQEPAHRLGGPMETILTQSDDVLYLPYGYAHCARAEGGASFHLSFALQGLSAGSVHKRVLDHVAGRLDLDSPAEASGEAWSRTVHDAARVLRSTAERLEHAAAGGSGGDEVDVGALRELLAGPVEGL